MKLKSVSEIMLLLLLIGTLTSAFNIQTVEASGTIYIRADGAVEPAASPIQRDGDTYTLTGNITSGGYGIVIERGNILVHGSGYTVQGAGSGYGFVLSGINNVTIRNTEIRGFNVGIWVSSSFYNKISGNTVEDNNWHGIQLHESSYNNITGNTVKNNNAYSGVWLEYSSFNTVSGNTIKNNIKGPEGFGVRLWAWSSNNTVSLNSITNHICGVGLNAWSSSNTISRNNITDNMDYGVSLSKSSYGIITGNTIINSSCGIRLYDSLDNHIHHNNFINNTQQVYFYIYIHANFWDDGYPSGGNYWSDYKGADLYGGPYQNETGSDGIGDEPYVIDEDNQDNYPLMNPYTRAPLAHDVAITDVQPSNNVVAQNQSVSINVTIENQGESTETFDVTVYASTIVIDAFTDVMLTWRNSTILTFTWNTTGFVEGVYIISATVTPVPDEIDTADNTYLDGLIIVGAGPPGNLIWVNPPLIDNLQWGDIFVVDLMINITDPDGPGNATGLFCFDYKLAWEPTKIDIVDITYHNPWSPSYSLVVKNETGVLPDGRHYHWLVIGATWQSAPFTGTTSLCTYTFYVNYQSYYPDPDYNGGLDIYDDMVYDDTATLIAHTTYDGQYRVPSKVPVHDVAVTGIALSKTIVGQGLCMPINVTVANQGNIPESFNITAYCNTTSLGTQTAIELVPSTNTTLTFTWNTTGVPYGNYTISAYADPVQGETYTADNTFTDGIIMVTIPGDVTDTYPPSPFCDFEVGWQDLFAMAAAYGSEPDNWLSNNWNPNCDINGDDCVGWWDLFTLAAFYGRTA